LEIKRVEALGQPFDGTWMQAIGSVASADYPPGHVAEQLAPCYLWSGAPLRFAEVRVARSSQMEVERDER
jgi:molecular chaperone GrpE (heat shock protein)